MSSLKLKVGPEYRVPNTYFLAQFVVTFGILLIIIFGTYFFAPEITPATPEERIPWESQKVWYLSGFCLAAATICGFGVWFKRRLLLHRYIEINEKSLLILHRVNSEVVSKKDIPISRVKGVLVTKPNFLDRFFFKKEYAFTVWLDDRKPHGTIFLGLGDKEKLEFLSKFFLEKNIKIRQFSSEMGRI